MNEPYPYIRLDYNLPKVHVEKRSLMVNVPIRDLEEASDRTREEIARQIGRMELERERALRTPEGWQRAFDELSK